MSAIRLLPWPLHQALGYLLGVLCVLAPFLLDFPQERAMPVLVGAGVALLALGVLGKGAAGVAQLLPVAVHVGLTYVAGFFLLLAPFVFGYTESDAALTASIVAGLALVVLTLVAAVPRPEARPEGEEAAETAAGPDEEP